MLAVPCWLGSDMLLSRWRCVARWSLNAHRFGSGSPDLSRRFSPAIRPCWNPGWDGVWLDEEEPHFIIVNPDDQVVIDRVLIGDRAGPSIGFVIAGCWNVVAEFLRSRGNSKPIIVMRRSFCSWVECSRSSSCAALLVLEPGGQDRRLLPSWMAAFWTRITCPLGTRRHRLTEPWVH
jgi:hypothetical protein